jgi:hypothetical protein
MSVNVNSVYTVEMKHVIMMGPYCFISFYFIFEGVIYYAYVPVCVR